LRNTNDQRSAQVQAAEMGFLTKSSRCDASRQSAQL